jgi:hypothetical protein
MFNSITLSTANYDSLLIGWNAQVLQSTVTFSGGNSTYCAGTSARANMISSDSWTITDGGDGCSSLSYSTETFSEAAANNGTITTTSTLTLTGDTFTTSGGAMTISSDYTVANVPSGLTMLVTGTSGTTATVALTGTASAHEDANDISNMTLTFLDAAFAGGSAVGITGYSNTSLIVDFDDAAEEGGGSNTRRPAPQCYYDNPSIGPVEYGSEVVIGWGVTNVQSTFWYVFEGENYGSNSEGVTIESLTETTEFELYAVNAFQATSCIQTIEVIEPTPLSCEATITTSDPTNNPVNPITAINQSEIEELWLSWTHTGGEEPYDPTGNQSPILVYDSELNGPLGFEPYTYAVETLDSSDPAQTTSCDATLTVVPDDQEILDPTIFSCTASFSNPIIQPGEESILSWTPYNGKEPYDTSGVNSPQTILGELEENEDSATSTYTVESVDNDGTIAICSAELTVERVQQPDPLSCSPTATPSGIMQGDSTDISWNVSGGSQPYTITDNSGSVLDPVYTVNPTENFVYSASVTDGANNTKQCFVGVTVNAPLPVEEECSTCEPDEDPQDDELNDPEPITIDDDFINYPGDDSVDSPSTQPEPEPEPEPETETSTPTQVTPQEITFRTVDLANLLDKSETKVGVTIALAVGLISAITGAFAGALGGSELLLIPGRLGNIFMTALGLKKRRRQWGTVYDARTKQPLDPVYVTLTNLETGKDQTAITDMDGRYSFLVDQPGKYRLTAKKKDYSFPSAALLGATSDHLYQDLYFGEPLTITGQGQVISKNIPLDPTGDNWNEADKLSNNRLKFYKKTDYAITKIADFLFYAGFIIALLSLVFFPKTLNIITFALYVLFAVLRKYGHSGRKTGSVTDANNNPVPYAVLRLISPSLGQEMKHAVADRYGRYHMLANNGTYNLKVEQRKQDQVIGERTYPNTKVKKGFFKGDVAV